MTSFCIRRSESPIHVRCAEPADAGAISQLYVRTYTPQEGGAACEYYPFPQIMEEDKVVELITGGTIVWLVAETHDGKIAGTAAAVRNIGGRQDSIAEVFGVAVEQTSQRRGLGSALLHELQLELADIAKFVLCEARTAEAGGWKAARNAGLQPVGFEPYAHAMPVGFESMVLTASCNWARTERAREVGDNTRASLRVAEAVRTSVPATIFSAATTNCQLKGHEILLADEVFTSPVHVRRDDYLGQVWFKGSAEALDRQSALVELCPLQGVEARFHRFEDAYYIASAGGSDVAAARVFYDRTDARARILGMRAVVRGAELPFVEGIVAHLSQLAKTEPLVIVVCLRAGTPATQIGLESIGFSPTAYFPGMISSPIGRADVIQYTRLFGRSWSESIRSVTALDWPEARRIIDQVLQFHADSANVGLSPEQG